MVPGLPVVLRLPVQGGGHDRLGANWLRDSAPVGALVGEQAFYFGLNAQEVLFYVVRRDHRNRYDLRQGAALLGFYLGFEAAEILIDELAVKFALFEA